MCRLVILGCRRPPPPAPGPQLSPPPPPAACRALTSVLLWISLSTAATQTVNKIHCIFVPLSSSVSWHIQTLGLKIVNNENNVFLSRQSRKGKTEASEGAAVARALCTPCEWFLDQRPGFTGLQISRELVFHAMSTSKEGFLFMFMIHRVLTERWFRCFKIYESVKSN